MLQRLLKKRNLMNNKRKYLIDVWQDTIDILFNKGMFTPDYRDYLMAETTFYSEKAFLSSHRKNQPCRIEVVNNDCLYVAKKLQKQGYCPCVLNMASYKQPGGGVINGSSAQEEDIFRRTTIALSLFQYHPIGERYGIKVNEEHSYPLDLNWGAIYSPNIYYIKKGRDKGYKRRKNLGDPFGVISIAAIKHPELIDGEMAPWAKDVTRNKIHQMLSIPYRCDHDALVLGAFGCGAYGNPPSQMAALFKEVLERDEYKYLYDKIVFAILEDKNSHKGHNPEGNLQPFLETFH